MPLIDVSRVRDAQQVLNMRRAEEAAASALSDLGRATNLVRSYTNGQVAPDSNLVTAGNLTSSARAQLQVVQAYMSTLQSSLETAESSRVAAEARAEAAELRASAAEASSRDLAVGASNEMTQQKSDSSAAEGVSLGVTAGVAGVSALLGGIVGYAIRGGNSGE